MRFSIARLCGGKALMVSPADDLGIDTKKAADVLSGIGVVKENDDSMIIMSWKGMEVTVYRNGKIMFHPLSDRDAAVEHAAYLLRSISGS